MRRITTIHSFCLSVIRDHFHVIDIDPGFRTAEEGELKLLRHDVLDELLEEKYAQKEERFLRFSNAYGGRRNDKKLEEMIEKAYDYSSELIQTERAGLILVLMHIESTVQKIWKKVIMETKLIPGRKPTWKKQNY